MATKKMFSFIFLNLVLLTSLPFSSLSQERTQVVEVDSLVRPPIERIQIIPLWVKQIDANIFFSDWATIQNQLLVSNSPAIFTDIKTGQTLTLNDQRIRDLKGSVLVTHSDSLLLVDLIRQHKTFMSHGRNVQRPKFSDDHDTTVIFVNGSTIFSYDKISQKNTSVFKDRKVIFDNVISIGNELLATGQYFDRKGDSTTNFCIRLNPAKKASIVYTNKASIYDMVFSNNHLYLLTRDDLAIINTSSWKLISRMKLTRPQKFLFTDGKFCSPNLTFDPNTHEFVPTSKFGWDSNTIALWNDWSVLNFDDHEVIRNYLVNRDHSKIFELDLHRDDFAPCKLEAFGDNAILEFIDSTEEYTVAVCRCENGLFLYGLKFPDRLLSKDN